MQKKNHTDVLDLVYSFQKKILENKPPQEQMYLDVRMMQFKIRPLQGDVSLLNLKNEHFIEILWSLGKLDEFFQGHIKQVSNKQKNTFYKLFDELYARFQNELNKINLQKEKSNDISAGFEMEIFKDRAMKKNWSPGFN